MITHKNLAAWMLEAAESKDPRRALIELAKQLNPQPLSPGAVVWFSHNPAYPDSWELGLIDDTGNNIIDAGADWYAKDNVYHKPAHICERDEVAIPKRKLILLRRLILNGSEHSQAVINEIFESDPELPTDPAEVDI